MNKILTILPVIAVSIFWISFLVVADYFIITTMTGNDRIQLLLFSTIFWLGGGAIIWKTLKGNLKAK